MIYFVGNIIGFYFADSLYSYVVVDRCVNKNKSCMPISFASLQILGVSL